MNKTLVPLVVTLLVTGCMERVQETAELGIVPEPGDLATATVSFSDDVQPILNARCVSCHSCYDAPCQLKLTAHEGVVRGGSKDRVYEPTRLREAQLSRLFFDAETTAQWRDRGFHPVVAQSSTSPERAQEFSLLLGLMDLKTANPLPAAKLLGNDLPLDDSDTWQCAANRDEFVEFAGQHPQRGMPYGLPGLSAAELGTIRRWVAEGSHDDSDYSLSQSEVRDIQVWEEFLNGDSLKSRLVARYIYEHLFLASLYFDEPSDDRYFQLVRSSTPPGTPIQLIATRRPYDDPEASRVYYRIRLNKEAVVAKTHMPYPLNAARLKNWTEWFFGSDYDVTDLPGYEITSASNPFETFSQLPVGARYRFMLSEANFTVKGFIKGPVCKGQSAVNVINEHFWVFFVEPDHQSGPAMTSFLASVAGELDLPAEREDTLRLFDAWDDFAENERSFLSQRREFVVENLSTQGRFDIDLVWDGEGRNPNAALTVFRHFDHASVHHGLIGQAPKTAWLIDYPLLERIHYLLVAGFDVYGNVSHQLLSRIYMDFLRMEGESLFLALLPQEARSETRAFWYRDADDRIDEFMSLMNMDEIRGVLTDQDAPEPMLGVLAEIEAHIGAAIDATYRPETALSNGPDVVLDTIADLQSGPSESFSLLPNVSFLEIVDSGRSQFATLIKHVGHTNNSSVLLEELNLEPQETTVSLVPGFIGPRPNAFMRMTVDELPDFGAALHEMVDESDYAALMDAYGIRRTDRNFWMDYDRFLDAFRESSEVNYGLLDLGKLENR